MPANPSLAPDVDASAAFEKAVGAMNFARTVGSFAEFLTALDARELALRRINAMPAPSQPPIIVCLRGSTRFKAEFEAAARAATLQGFTVVRQ